MSRTLRCLITLLSVGFLVSPSVHGAQVTVTDSEPSLPSPAPILAGIAVDHAGHVYVADTKNGHIYVLSQSLQLLSVWTIPHPPGPYSVHLVGVTIDRHGATYTTDLDDRIFKLTPQGAVQATWGSPGSQPGQFRHPWGIAVGTAGNLLVADNYNHRVQVLSPAGKPLAQWQLYSPHDLPGGPCGLQYLAIGPRGQVYVTDDCYGRVFKLSPTGKVLQIWGQKGHGPGQFSGIAGVGVGPRGNVFVGEAFRILKFALDGRLLGSFRKSGYPGYPFSPAGIAADSHGMIYVADAENYRVFKLSPSGRTVAMRCLRRAGCRGSYASGRRAGATP
jgi:tripartite motif-containing protein 71